MHANPDDLTEFSLKGGQEIFQLSSLKFKRYGTIRKYLDLGLDILDGVAGLHLQGDRLPRQGLHEDLHFGLPSLYF
jgi:hypothetical protein